MARYKPANGTNDVLVRTGKGKLVGWSLHESTAAAEARAYVRDSVDNTGPIVAVISLNNDESDTPAYPGVVFETGIYFDVTAGSFEGSIYFE